LTWLLTKAADAAGATVISTDSHHFEHQGVTAFAILAESHISIHTWPEIGHAACDIFTCGGDHVDCDAAGEYLAYAFNADDVQTQRMERFRNAEQE
jgi:S-adenosylmethionine decarboxylase